MKKVLLLDTNVSSFPIYNFLIEEGYDVYVAGSRDSDCLAKCTGNYINLDYSNIDLLNQVIRENGFDYIVPGCNDMSYLCATMANKNRNFLGMDITDVCETINNKYKFRKFAILNNLNVPKIYSRDESYSLNTPLIVKPVDAYSGRGISVIKNPDKSKIELAIKNAIEFSKNSDFVIEEYVEGQLYSHSSFIIDKKIIKDFIVIENCTANPFTVDSSFVIHDNFPGDILEGIRRDTEIIARELDLVDGLIHTQFIKTEKSFKIIEVTRRCPGDLYSLLIEKSTNFPYAENYTKPFIGKKIDLSEYKIENKLVFRHTISSRENIFPLGIKFNSELDIDLFIPMMITGDELKKSPFGRFGLFFINCKNHEELDNINDLSSRRELYSYK